MSRQNKPKLRLSRRNWLDTALELLHNDGINSVTVEALAKQLGITRGSFYHHFKDRKDLSNEMLEYWKRKWTVEIRDTVAALGLDGSQSLIALGNLIKHRQAAGYDIAVRAWAVHDEHAKEVVRVADKIRLDFIRNQFEKIGFEGLELENRSRLFLYYAMTEPAFFDAPDEETALLLDQVRFDFLTTPS
ncbi:TetR/AcrR family transcriptional regulator [Pseudomonadota bacterium]